MTYMGIYPYDVYGDMALMTHRMYIIRPFILFMIMIMVVVIVR